jgi:protein kinase A
MEKKILGSISFPFITSLVYSFKDNSNLYMVLPFVAGGEMFAHLHKVSRFSEALTKFYMSQIVLAVEYLHNLGIQII